MTVFRFVFNVRSVNGDFPRLLLGGLVNLFIRHGLGPSLFTEDLANGLREGRLAVIDVSDGSNVDVRLGPVKGFCRKGPTQNAKQRRR